MRFAAISAAALAIAIAAPAFRDKLRSDWKVLLER